MTHKGSPAKQSSLENQERLIEYKKANAKREEENMTQSFVNQYLTNNFLNNSFSPAVTDNFLYKRNTVNQGSLRMLKTEQDTRKKVCSQVKPLDDQGSQIPPRQKSQMNNTQHDRSFVNLKSEIIRQSLSKNKAKQNNLLGSSVMSRTSSSQQVQYDFNGRKNNQTKQERDTEQDQRAQALIEDQYHAIQQSYDQIFKSQQDYQLYVRNQQLMNMYLNQANQYRELEQRSKESISQIGNSGSFQNNINNSIISIIMPSTFREDPNLSLLKEQLTLNQIYNGTVSNRTRQNSNSPNSLNDKDRNRDSKIPISTNRDKTQQEFNFKVAPQKRRAIVKKSKKEVEQASPKHNQSQNSVSGDRSDNQDPEYIERQNNRMLMQVLLNNLKKKSTPRKSAVQASNDSRKNPSPKENKLINNDSPLLSQLEQEKILGDIVKKQGTLKDKKIDKKDLKELSEKIQQLLKDNQLFKEVNETQISKAMVRLLTQQKQQQNIKNIIKVQKKKQQMLINEQSTKIHAKNLNQTNSSFNSSVNKYKIKKNYMKVINQGASVNIVGKADNKKYIDEHHDIGAVTGRTSIKTAKFAIENNKQLSISNNQSSINEKISNEQIESKKSSKDIEEVIVINVPTQENEEEFIRDEVDQDQQKLASLESMQKSLQYSNHPNQLIQLTERAVISQQSQQTTQKTLQCQVEQQVQEKEKYKKVSIEESYFASPSSNEGDEKQEEFELVNQNQFQIDNSESASALSFASSSISKENKNSLNLNKYLNEEIKLIKKIKPTTLTKFKLSDKVFEFSKIVNKDIQINDQMPEINHKLQNLDTNFKHDYEKYKQLQSAYPEISKSDEAQTMKVMNLINNSKIDLIKESKPISIQTPYDTFKRDLKIKQTAEKDMLKQFAQKAPPSLFLKKKSEVYNENLLQIPQNKSKDLFMKIRTQIIDKINDANDGAQSLMEESIKVKMDTTQELEKLARHLNKSLTFLKVRPELFYKKINLIHKTRSDEACQIDPNCEQNSSQNTKFSESEDQENFQQTQQIIQNMNSPDKKSETVFTSNIQLDLDDNFSQNSSSTPRSGLIQSIYNTVQFKNRIIKHDYLQHEEKNLVLRHRFINHIQFQAKNNLSSQIMIAFRKQPSIDSQNSDSENNITESLINLKFVKVEDSESENALDSTISDIEEFSNLDDLLSDDLSSSDQQVDALSPILINKASDSLSEQFASRLLQTHFVKNKMYAMQTFGPINNLLTFFYTAEQSSFMFDRPKYDIIHQQLEQFEIQEKINIQQSEKRFKFKCMMHEMLSEKFQTNKPTFRLKAHDINLFLSKKHEIQNVVKFISTSFKSLRLKYKINNYIKPLVFQTMIFEEWKEQRLLSVIKYNIKQQSVILSKENMESLWNSQALSKILNPKNNIQAEEDNLSSDLEEQFKSIVCVNGMHENFNPSYLLSVIKEKNAQWEIFKILSQTKLCKIKNKLHNSVLLLDARLEKIHNNLRNDRNHYLYAANACESSDLNFSDSLEDKAKYMYVEEYQYQSQVREQVLNFLSGRSQQDIQTCSIDLKAIIEEQSRKEKKNKDPVYGFRYGSKENLMASTQRSMRRTEQESIIQLSNGMKIDSSKNQNVQIKPIDHIPLKKKAIKDLEKIQGYYDEIKEQILKTRDYKQQINKLERKKFLAESQFNIDKTQNQKHIIKQKLMEYIQSKEDKLAISINMTKLSMKKYMNPFAYKIQYKPKHQKNFAEDKKSNSQENYSEYSELSIKKGTDMEISKPYEEEQPISFQLVRFKFIDLEEDFNKESQNYKRGGKCVQFKQVVKYQSLGDVRQVKELENEIKQTTVEADNILQYHNILDESSGYPIYMMFEVIHVARKTKFDIAQEQQLMRLKFQQQTNFIIGGQDRVIHPESNFMREVADFIE